jgi:hypothetical protein
MSQRCTRRSGNAAEDRRRSQKIMERCRSSTSNSLEFSIPIVVVGRAAPLASKPNCSKLDLMPSRRRRNTAAMRRRGQIVSDPFSGSHPATTIEGMGDSEIVCDICNRSYSRNHGGFTRHRRSCEREKEERRLIQERRERERGKYLTSSLCRSNLFDIIGTLPAIRDILRFARPAEAHHRSNGDLETLGMLLELVNNQLDRLK